MSDHLGYSATDDRTMPAVAYGLYLLSFATAGLTGIIGLIIAYAQRATASEMARSHYTLLIRTFWMGLAVMLAAGVMFAIGIPLSFVLIGIPLLLLAKLVVGLTCVWWAIRCVVGLVHLSRGEPYPRPYALLA